MWGVGCEIRDVGVWVRWFMGEGVCGCLRVWGCGGGGHMWCGVVWGGGGGNLRVSQENKTFFAPNEK